MLLEDLSSHNDASLWNAGRRQVISPINWTHQYLNLADARLSLWDPTDITILCDLSSTLTKPLDYFGKTNNCVIYRERDDNTLTLWHKDAAVCKNHAHFKTGGAFKQIAWLIHSILLTFTCTNIPEIYNTTLIARFMGPTWGPSGADRTQVGPMLAPWTLLSENNPNNGECHHQEQ